MVADESSPLVSWIWQIITARSKHNLDKYRSKIVLNQTKSNYNLKCFLKLVGSIFILPEVRGQAVTQAG